jgi:alkylation response protein AidB-like acyl-CoA dehydrogenase
VIEGILAAASELADDVLFPRALETDAAPLVPVDLLDLLAAEGFYGMAAPTDVGGWDLPIEHVQPVVETLAGGCLATTFVWIQHHNVVRAVSRTDTPGLRDAWLGPLAHGDRRAGIALAGERPGPALLTARPDGNGGLVLDGEAPWLTGWGRIDAVLVAARAGDRVVRALVEAVASSTLTVTPLDLVAVNASGTVVARFSAHPVPASHVVGWETHDEAVARDATGLRTNGSLPLGLASRCCRLLGPGPLDDELVAVRAALDAADPSEMPAARARAAAFAWRAAGALVAAAGATSVVRDQHAQRLAREAMFTLVFGSRPPIKAALVDGLVRG